MITNDDYTFMENADYPDNWVVRIKTGKYTDVAYAYGKVQAKVKDNEGLASLDFKYTIIDNPTEEDLDGNEEFGNHIGDILQHIIADAFETGNYKVGDGSEHSNNNSTKPN